MSPSMALEARWKGERFSGERLPGERCPGERKLGDQRQVEGFSGAFSFFGDDEQLGER